MAKKETISPMGEFMNFIREQGVVGLAVGLAIGAQVTNTVGNLVTGLIDPLVAWLLGWFIDDIGNLAAATITFGEGEHALTIGWGLILSAIIRLLAVAAVIFYFVKWLKLDKLDKKKDD